jgi:hypothetical protein
MYSTHTLAKWQSLNIYLGNRFKVGADLKKKKKKKKIKFLIKTSYLKKKKKKKEVKFKVAPFISCFSEFCFFQSFSKSKAEGVNPRKK